VRLAVPGGFPVSVPVSVRVSRLVFVAVPVCISRLVFVVVFVIVAAHGALKPSDGAYNLVGLGRAHVVRGVVRVAVAFRGHTLRKLQGFHVDGRGGEQASRRQLVQRVHTLGVGFGDGLRVQFQPVGVALFRGRQLVNVRPQVAAGC
jgi:hypothetical protein